jgi:membrane-associated phospholipid phosphatase
MPLRKKYDYRIADIRVGRIVIGALVAIIQLVAYQVLQQYNAVRMGATESWDISLLVDDVIPLIPEFAFVYFLYIPGLIVPALLDMPFTLYLRYALSLVLSVVIACFCFAFVPLKITHEALICTDWTCSGLMMLRSLDAGVNLLPSLHASQTLLAAMVMVVASHRYGVRTFWWAWGMFLYLPIIASTLLTKQHYVVDLLAGFFVGLVTWKLALLFVGDELIVGEEPDQDAT